MRQGGAHSLGVRSRQRSLSGSQTLLPRKPRELPLSLLTDLSRIDSCCDALCLHLQLAPESELVQQGAGQSQSVRLI